VSCPSPADTPSDWSVLRRNGACVVVAHPPAGLPWVAHWGADLGDLTLTDLTALDAATSRQTRPGTLDAAWRLSLLPAEADGWAGRPAVLVTRSGLPVFPRWTVTETTTNDTAVDVIGTDAEAGLTVRTRIEIGAGGLVLVEHDLTNLGAGPVEVGWLEPTLPVPRSADHLTTFAGRWTREKVPLTTLMPRGSTTRQSRRGRPGHDAPTITVASVAAPRDRSGEIWAVHLGWSADTTYRTDRMTDHVTLLGAGELLRPGEVVLQPGETYRSPVAYFAWSDTGLDGMTARFHTWLRARPQHPRGPRPLVLNTWEAVYFDHDPRLLAKLAERAAEVGVELFVLDDGWFHDRRDDTRGLGDWRVDPAVWPDGLEPLAEQVHALGMQFGLWFEPEMVNLDSDLARARPEWLLHNPAHVPTPDGLSWRTQYLLDLAEPAAWEHIRTQIDTLVTRLGIDFIKWDHNRDLVEPLHDGRPGTHAQTLATYRLIARLKADHPGLEIESCSSGGARSDFGILAVTDRVWASDSNDPVERQDIQRWTQLLLPPELVGGHVGPTTSHSSGRTTDLSYRLATSLMGSAGFEWDILQCSPEELTTITRFAALYKEVRHILHTGVAVHADPSDAALRVVGSVTAERDQALFSIASIATLEDALPERIRLHGLDQDRRYRVRLRNEIGAARSGWITPAWLTQGEITLTGRMLSTVGLQIPVLWPAQALVLHLTT
jgi:alpha-galactosidase